MRSDYGAMTDAVDEPSNNCSRVVTVDEWLASAGGFGRFQWQQVFMVGVLAYGIVPAMWVCQPVFLNPKVKEGLDVSDASMDLTSSLTFLGWGIGAFLWTKMADTVGRKPVVFLTCAASVAVSAVAALAPTFAVYAICRLLLGACLGGMGATGYILMIELLPPEQRGPMTILGSAFFAVGVTVLSVVAWLLQTTSWRVEVALESLPGLLFLMCYPLVYESPRWLSTVGQTDRAEQVLGAVSSVNGVVINETYRLSHTALESDPDDIDGQAGGCLGSVIRMMRPSLRLQALALFFCWFAVTFVYYGLGFAVGDMPGDVYTNSALMALAELPAYVIIYMTLDNPAIGRRWTQIGAFLMAGTSLAGIALLSANGGSDMVQNGLAMLGKLGASGAFVCVYVFAGEVFPTSVRGIGLGCCNIFSRIGGILAPLAPRIGSIMLAYCGFGACAFFGGLITMVYLKETLGKPLQDVMAEDVIVNHPRDRTLEKLIREDLEL